MGTFLRVLVIILLPLTIACLVLGILLFDRREMLKGRTQKLEDTLIKLAPVIEIETATLEDKPSHIAKDIAACTSELLDNPEKSDFWNSYKDHLELPDQPVMDLKSKENELTLFYKLDPVTGKRFKDPVSGYYVTQGPGTMQPLLDELIEKAENQLNRLNETRQQLLVIRQELEATITDLNSTKTRLREALNKIVQLDAEIGRLNSEIDKLNGEIATLNDRIAQLEDTIREKDREIGVLTEKLSDRDLEIKNLKEHIRKLEIEIRRVTQPGSGGVDTAIVLGDGVKGRVIAVDNKWKFVVVELSQEFIDELTKESRIGLDLTQLNLQFDLMRPAGQGRAYVCRIRLREARIDEKLGLGDILTEWQQIPIRIGDEAIR